MTSDELKNLRKKHKLTQAELATKIGMNRKSICEMEGAKTPIELRTELAILYVIQKGI